MNAKQNHRSHQFLTALVAFVLLGSIFDLSAADKTWNVLSGNWSDAGNWDAVGVPVAADPSGDNIFVSTNGSTITLNTTVGNSTVRLGNFTIGTGALVQGNAGTGFPGINLDGTFSNSGTIRPSGSGTMQFYLRGASRAHTNSGVIEATSTGLILEVLNSSTFSNAGTVSSKTSTGLTLRASGGSSITNNGTMEASGTNALLSIAGPVTNTSGLIRATGGGIVDWLTGGTISNGTLQTDASSVLRTQTSAGSSFTPIFSNVATTNAGTVNVIANGAFVFTITASNTFNGGSLVNNGTVNVNNTSSGALPTATSHSATFTSNTTFTNNGTINVLNSATGSTTGTATKNATFQVASGSTFTNAGSILVSHTSAVANTNASFLVNNGATGAGNFTNGGNVTISGSAATFVVQNSRDYVQSATGTTTLLQNGGTLGATNVSITGGSLGGIGIVNGAISIGANGTLFAGSGSTNGNLTVSTVSLANGADLAFNLTSTAAYSRVLGTSMTLANGTYTITLNGIGSQAINLNDAFTLFNGTVNNFAGATFNIVNNTNWSGGWQVSEGSLIVTAIPEPTTWLLLTASLGTLMIFRRRRVSRM